MDNPYQTPPCEKDGPDYLPRESVATAMLCCFAGMLAGPVLAPLLTFPIYGWPVVIGPMVFAVIPGVGIGLALNALLGNDILSSPMPLEQKGRE